jgi:hypothetical protein
MPGPRSADFKKFAAFGSGVGIEVGDKNLEVTLARVRPSGIDVAGATTIANFGDRPAAEWGAEYGRFLRESGGSHLSATVLLPRREVIVRHVALPGVAARDVAAAIALQIDSLHPYGDDEVVFGWSRLENGGILIGILLRSALDRYIALFSEAGVAVSSFTFSAAAVYAAHRLPVGSSEGPYASDGFVAVAPHETGAIEVYGESAARPVFSAEFDLPPDRVAALAISELRLSPDAAPLALDRILPAPRNNPITNDLARRPLPYATALAGACPWLASTANLLPPEYRQSNSRSMYLPTIVLGSALLLLAGTLAAHSAISDHRYLKDLESAIASLEPQAKRAAALDGKTARAQPRVRLLDEFRGRTKADLDSLNELTAIVAPPAWTGMIELTPDAAIIAGETDQAAPLLKVIDASPYFQNSAFVGSLAKSGGNEQFQIRTLREARR